MSTGKPRAFWCREHLVSLCRTRIITVVIFAVVLLFLATYGEFREIRRTEPDIFSPQQLIVAQQAIIYSDSRITLDIIVPIISPRPKNCWPGLARVIHGVLNETLIRNVTVHVVTDDFSGEPDSDRRSAAVAAATRLNHPRLSILVYRLCDFVVDPTSGDSTCSVEPRALPGARSFSRVLRQLNAVQMPTLNSIITLLGAYAHRWLGSIYGVESLHPPQLALLVDPRGLRVAGDMWEIVTEYIPRMHTKGSLIGLSANTPNPSVLAGVSSASSVYKTYTGSVQLLNLQAMRATSTFSVWLTRFNATLAAYSPASPPAADASLLYTQLALDHPDLVHDLGCQWNRRPTCAASLSTAALPSTPEQLRDLCPRVVHLLYSVDAWVKDAGLPVDAKQSEANGKTSIFAIPGCEALISSAGESCGNGLRFAHADFERAAISRIKSVAALDSLQADRDAAMWALSAIFQRKTNLTLTGRS